MPAESELPGNQASLYLNLFCQTNHKNEKFDQSLHGLPIADTSITLSINK